MAIRYRFVDRYIGPTQRVAPPRLEVVQPMLDFIQKFWVDPFLEVQNGEAYFRAYVPSEVVLLGGFIYNDDGTVVLGTADAGAQITFTYVNAIDPTDKEWEALQLQTVYHEFAHIVHQRNKLPADFEKISPAGYTSPGFWVSLSDEDALKRGFVSPYGTSSPNEDFAETVAFFLYNPNFDSEFMTDESNCLTPECEARNAGRELVREKLTAIREHYVKVVGVDLQAVRNAIQAKLN
jgi:substrate import-associated zinc metallohydrolase lipoprotein